MATGGTCRAVQASARLQDLLLNPVSDAAAMTLLGSSEAIVARPLARAKPLHPYDRGKGCRDLRPAAATLLTLN